MPDIPGTFEALELCAGRAGGVRENRTLDPSCYFLQAGAVVERCQPSKTQGAWCLRSAPLALCSVTAEAAGRRRCAAA